MERKDYLERILNVKNDILSEIRDFLGCDKRHEFKDKFYIHFVDGEVATTEICSAVEVWFEGGVVLCTAPESFSHKEITRGDEEVIEGETVFNYEPESLLDVLENLKKEIREEKIESIRDFIKKNGATTFVCNEIFLKVIIADNGIQVTRGIGYDEEIFSQEKLDEETLNTLYKKVKEAEKDFSITPEQQDLINEFDEIVKKMRKSGLKILYNYDDGETVFVNAKEEEIMLVYDLDEKRLNLDEFVRSLNIFDDAFYANEHICVGL